MNLSILNEIPLSDKDCFHVVERYKTNSPFPPPTREFEINFIEHGKGLKRTIGIASNMLKTTILF